MWNYDVGEKLAQKELFYLWSGIAFSFEDINLYKIMFDYIENCAPNDFKRLF